MSPYNYKALRREESKCIKCRICETMLSGFITEHEGELLLKPDQYEREDTQRAIDDVINSCLGKAITLENITNPGTY